MLIYCDFGVDIDKGNDLVKWIFSLVELMSRLGVDVKLGGFGGFFDLVFFLFEDLILVFVIDGVGIKFVFVYEFDVYFSIGIDFVVMCVNDILV